MNLAAIFVIVIYFLGLVGPHLGSPSVEQPSSAQDQAPTAQSANPAPASSPQTPNTAPPAKHRTHAKKTVPDCSDSPAALNPPGGGNLSSASSPDNAKPASDDAHSSPANQTAATETPTPNSPSAAKPCPPPKKVVKNGGSDEPIVELKGNTTAEQASLQRSTTDQLTVATEQNLKKVADLQLSPSQQEMVSQVKQFMDQAKKALAAGDLQRGHNLAVKANLLSAELVKP
jgi:hypothetical protein